MTGPFCAGRVIVVTKVPWV